MSVKKKFQWHHRESKPQPSGLQRIWPNRLRHRVPLTAYVGWSNCHQGQRPPPLSLSLCLSHFHEINRRDMKTATDRGLIPIFIISWPRAPYGYTKRTVIYATIEVVHWTFGSEWEPALNIELRRVREGAEGAGNPLINVVTVNYLLKDSALWTHLLEFITGKLQNRATTSLTAPPTETVWLEP